MAAHAEFRDQGISGDIFILHGFPQRCIYNHCTTSLPGDSHYNISIKYAPSIEYYPNMDYNIHGESIDFSGRRV